MGTAALGGDPSRGRLGYMRCPFGSALRRDATFCVSSHRMHRSRRYARDARYCVSTRTDSTCRGIGFVSHDLLTLFPIPHSEFRNPHSRGPPPPVVGFVSHIRHSVETQHFASPSIECAGPADAPETQDIASLRETRTAAGSGIGFVSQDRPGPCRAGCARRPSGRTVGFVSQNRSRS